MWVANRLGSAQIDTIIEQAQALGLNTVLPNVAYAPADELNAFAARARRHGIATHAWVERGIKSNNPPMGPDTALYLPCDDGGVDHGSTKWYLDVRKPEARAKFLDQAVELVGGLDVDAVHWDDHLGYNTLKLDCVTTTNRASLEASLTGLVGELKTRLRRSKPGMKFIFSHHNTYWAKDKFLADWTRWRTDGMFVQAYVSNSFATEVVKAKKSGAMGLGINGEDPAIVANTKRALDAGLSVIYFKLPPRQHTAALGALLKARGTNPTASPLGPVAGTSGATETSSGTQYDPSQGDPSQGSVASGPSSHPSAGQGGSTYPSQGNTSSGSGGTGGTPGGEDDGIDPTRVTKADARAACASVDSAVKADWSESCRTTPQGQGILSGKSTCEVRACMATGGGYSCNSARSFHRDHFCSQMLPLMK